MSHSAKKPASPRQISANRINALKSTGPRSLAGKVRSSGNSLKHGRYAGRYPSYFRSLFINMPDLAEDSREFLELRQGHFNSLRPAGEAQNALVDEIVLLRWERLRLVRAQTGLLARRIRDLEVKRQRKCLEMSQKISQTIPTSQIKMGLLWAEDSATKFQKILEWLDCLKFQADKKEFKDADAFFDWSYGPNPTLRGATMKEAFRQLAQAGDELPPDHPSLASVRRELLAEMSNVTQQYDLYFKKDVEVTAAMREECLVPTASQRWLMRQMNMIDRQIESKIRLLLEMQRSENRRSEPLETNLAEQTTSTKENV